MHILLIAWLSPCLICSLWLDVPTFIQKLESLLHNSKNCLIVENFLDAFLQEVVELIFEFGASLNGFVHDVSQLRDFASQVWDGLVLVLEVFDLAESAIKFVQRHAIIFQSLLGVVNADELWKAIHCLFYLFENWPVLH